MDGGGFAGVYTQFQIAIVTTIIIVASISRCSICNEYVLFPVDFDVAVDCCTVLSMVLSTVTDAAPSFSSNSSLSVPEPISLPISSSKLSISLSKSASLFAIAGSISGVLFSLGFVGCLLMTNAGSSIFSSLRALAEKELTRGCKLDLR